MGFFESYTEKGQSDYQICEVFIITTKLTKVKDQSRNKSKAEKLFSWKTKCQRLDLFDSTFGFACQKSFPKLSCAHGHIEQSVC